MFRQDFTCPALLKDECFALPVRGCHPLWPAFQTVPVVSHSPLAWSAFARHY